MKLFGIPIKFEISFFVIVLFLGSSRLSTPILVIEWVVVVALSILIHEFGHALMGKAFAETALQLLEQPNCSVT